MASKKLIVVSAIVLLSVLGAASARPQCMPGWAIPHNPLQGCRTYVVSKTCGIGPYLPMWTMKEQCCRELSAIPAYCRCEALRILMDGVVTVQGVSEGGLQDWPRCPRETQRSFAAILTTPEECNLGTIHGGPHCHSLIGREVAV